MRVKSVYQESYQGKPRYVIQFEHNNTRWEKFLACPTDDLTIKNLLNSVIEDTLARAQ